MQWSKYERLRNSGPVVARCLNEIVGPPSLRWNGSHRDFASMQSWVEQQLMYVAVRPWEALDLSWTNVDRGHANTFYTIFFHIEGTLFSSERMRGLWGEHDELLTIDCGLQGIVDWFGHYWAKRPGCSLVFDAVVRDAHGTVPDKKYPEQTINIWLPPAGFMPSTTS